MHSTWICLEWGRCCACYLRLISRWWWCHLSLCLQTLQQPTEVHTIISKTNCGADKYTGRVWWLTAKHWTGGGWSAVFQETRWVGGTGGNCTLGFNTDLISRIHIKPIPVKNFSKFLWSIIKLCWPSWRTININWHFL